MWHQSLLGDFDLEELQQAQCVCGCLMFPDAHIVALTVTTSVATDGSWGLSSSLCSQALQVSHTQELYMHAPNSTHVYAHAHVLTCVCVRVCLCNACLMNSVCRPKYVSHPPSNSCSSCTHRTIVPVSQMCSLPSYRTPVGS